MAKRKNPLKDLDSFLKQEAASIVAPDQVNVTSSSPEALSDTADVIVKETSKSTTKEDVIAFLKNLHSTNPHDFRTELFYIIQKSLETSGMKHSSDKMLMNTILYLENPQNWKEAIRNYWKSQ
ncbi:hypothetical protein FNH22_14650 [Fulvivirga sp. M361]|uniref:hypothetical protein n=1 Tax=Fulvivirga sp. M361 TaxID=2594266 RepID=UPI00117BBFAD|nr:hypothetical protein [Fulvivirga sp. M361]TRX58295.1 hypothetical protein FNH22_14650 [Fulvivirga sp. M361]